MVLLGDMEDTTSSPGIFMRLGMPGIIIKMAIPWISVTCIGAGAYLIYNGKSPMTKVFGLFIILIILFVNVWIMRPWDRKGG